MNSVLESFSPIGHPCSIGINYSINIIPKSQNTRVPNWCQRFWDCGAQTVECIFTVFATVPLRLTPVGFNSQWNFGRKRTTCPWDSNSSVSWPFCSRKSCFRSKNFPSTTSSLWTTTRLSITWPAIMIFWDRIHIFVHISLAGGYEISFFFWMTNHQKQCRHGPV
jgi:hypothetical protein